MERGGISSQNIYKVRLVKADGLWYNVPYETNGGTAMKHRLSRMLVCVSLAALFTTGVLAVDPASMTDIAGHWAEKEMFILYI